MTDRRPQVRWGIDDEGRVFHIYISRPPLVDRHSVESAILRATNEASGTHGRRRARLHRPRRGGVRKGLLGLVALVASLGSCNSSATAAPSPDCESCAWAYEVCVDLARAETIAEIAAREPGAMDRYRERRLACDRSYKACVTTCQPQRIACGRRAR